MKEVIEKENKAYHSIHPLIYKLSNDECSRKDYKIILFHFWQINHKLI
ncbi:hypothetical protein CLV33_105232 [Jejuia pallidilutea]|uniref:Uncharacterized protein n=1 Tax=Jejuia pallidilutea TaxID=504487 RepID=A0A362X2L5_9FLAO|nr:hypothetical protein CLV33_105232 [Jejuia pallidilutea]